MGGSIVTEGYNPVLAETLEQIHVLPGPPITRTRDHEDTVLIIGEYRMDGDEEWDEPIIESMEEIPSAEPSTWTEQ